MVRDHLFKSISIILIYVRFYFIDLYVRVNDQEIGYHVLQINLQQLKLDE